MTTKIDLFRAIINSFIGTILGIYTFTLPHRLFLPIGIMLILAAMMALVYWILQLKKLKKLSLIESEFKWWDFFTCLGYYILLMVFVSKSESLIFPLMIGSLGAVFILVNLIIIVRTRS